MIFAERQIRLITLLLSILIHAVLFVKFANLHPGSQAQAAKLATRISLNLLTPAKPAPQQEPVEPAPVKQARMAKQKSVEQTKMIPAVPEQAVALQIAEEVRRQQLNDNVRTKQRYLSHLLTHIEGHKYYPRKAQRQGMQASIHVSFQLLADGDIRQLVTSGGPLLLRRAAKGTVQKALPLPACPPEVNCPMQISYAMQFKLR